MFLINPYIYGSGTPAFSPTDISGLSLWFDPDDSSTLVLSGSSITTIADKVSANTAAATGSPSIVTSGGRDWMSFGGSDGLFSTTLDTQGNVGAGSYTLIIVLKTSSSTTNMTVYNKGAPNLYRTRANFTAAGNIGVVRVGPSSGNVQNNGGTGLNDGNPHWSAHIFDSSALRLRSLLDNSEINAPGTSVSTADNINTAGTNGRLTIACAWNGSIYTTFFNGQVGEILLYNSVLSAGNLSDLDTYLSAKWGI